MLDEEILASIEVAESLSLPVSADDLHIYDVLRYHLGFLSEKLEPQRSVAGKRIRPRLVTLVTAAAGGDVRVAIHTAAAIELLHNFTLIHDDIQDQSPLRRHRPTVWSLWGIPQAINAGDAMFAVAHLALNRSLQAGVSAANTMRLSTQLHQTTLRIVEGQTLDLSFESRSNVSSAEYLRMIGGKTSAITRLACWAGGLLAETDEETANELGEFGFALGIGFQVQDDWLGVWGEPALTGKVAADDIRRRKKSLPVLMLHDRAEPTDRARLDELYAQPEIQPAEVDEIHSMLTLYEIAGEVRAAVVKWHDRSAAALERALSPGPVRDELTQLVESLGGRSG